MTLHCFTYGSLMCEEIMSMVCGRPCHGEPALLHGHQRHPVRGEDYPGMVERQGHKVRGLLYRMLDEAAFARLDAFEGLEYERVRREVCLPDDTRIVAWTYLFRPAFHHRLQPGEWDFEAFLRQGRQRFIARYAGFGQIEPPSGD